MNTQNKRLMVVGGLAVVIIIGVIVLFKGSPVSQNINLELVNQEVSTNEPVDIVSDFYNPWLGAVKTADMTPYSAGLADQKILSKELRERLKNAEGQPDTEIDPVLCQSTVPERVTARIVSKSEDLVRVLVLAKEKTITAQSVFVVKKHNEGWYINDIECAGGEFAPEREFTFEKEGFLLKSVPKPFNSKYWHLVFEENGELGHVVPLIFNDKSTCLDSGGTQAVCNPDQFREATGARIFGQMTESGAEVIRLEFTE